MPIFTIVFINDMNIFLISIILIKHRYISNILIGIVLKFTDFVLKMFKLRTLAYTINRFNNLKLLFLFNFICISFFKITLGNDGLVAK